MTADQLTDDRPLLAALAEATRRALDEQLIELLRAQLAPFRPRLELVKVADYGDLELRARFASMGIRLVVDAQQRARFTTAEEFADFLALELGRAWRHYQPPELEPNIVPGED